MKMSVAHQPPTPLNLNMNPSTSPQHPLDLFFYSNPTSPRFASSSPSSYYHHRHNSNRFFFGDDNDDDRLDEVSLLAAREKGFPASATPTSVPFNWELMPGVPKHKNIDYDEQVVDDMSFEFDLSGQLDIMVRPSISSADELFDGGKIKPLKPPPRLQNGSLSSSEYSPKSSSPIMSKFKDALSPRQRISHRDDDPFEAALHNSTTTTTTRGNDRGRARSGGGVRRGNSRKGISRSLSPLRVSEFALLHQQRTHLDDHTNDDKNRSLLSSSKKWRLKDLFLFRSASEGRSTTSLSGAKDPLRKLFSFSRRNNSIDKDKDTDKDENCIISSKNNNNNNNKIMMTTNDSKNSSFRSSTSGGSVSKRSIAGQGKVSSSAHEKHYTAKRAVSEELKKKTSLPYKHGLLSCLGFNPILHDLSHAFGSLPLSS